MRVLFADSLASADCYSLIRDQRGERNCTIVSTADSIPDEEYGRVVVVERGDEASWNLLRAALEYRDRYPLCDLQVLSSISADWSSTETLARVKAMRGRGSPCSLSISTADVTEILKQTEEVAVTFSEDGVYFEYAA